MSEELDGIRGRPTAGLDRQVKGFYPVLHLTRFYGGTDGVCMQLTIGESFVQLDAQGCAALVGALTEIQQPGEDGR